MKKNLSDIQSILETVKKVLAARPEIVAAYLYGSYAKGYARADSDVDIAVMLKPDFDLGPGYDYMINLEIKVNEEVQARHTKAPHIEVIPLAYMGYPLKYTSSLFGRKIYCRDEKQRIREEEELMRRYEDLELFHDLRYNYIIAEVKERLGRND